MNNMNCYQFAFNRPVGELIPHTVEEIEKRTQWRCNKNPDMNKDIVIMIGKQNDKHEFLNRHFIKWDANSKKFMQKCGGGGRIEESIDLFGFQTDYTKLYEPMTIIFFQ